MDEKQHSGGKDEVVDAPPERTPNAGSKERREEDEHRRYRAAAPARLMKGCSGDSDWQENVEEAEVRLV